MGLILSEQLRADRHRVYRDVQMHLKAAAAQTAYSLVGRLYRSRTGWIFLSVPNALVRGSFDALQEPGAELPTQDGQLDAHISVMRPEELERIGGPDALSERGHTFRYTLGRLKTVRPPHWDGVSRVWYIEVKSPELERLRKSYGLSRLPNGDKYPFHVTVALRRTHVLGNNETRKTN